MFDVSKVAKDLQVTPQAIYKQRDYLLDNGLMVKDKFGQWRISTQGYNYLKEKRINKLNQLQGKVINNSKPEAKEEPKTQRENLEDAFKSVYIKQVELLENQLTELRADRDYFKSLYEEKDRQLNQYINTHLLPQASEQAENHKGFFKRFFSKWCSY